ncbi:ferritin-like domain-containing protein [Bacillaceae bacterium Marseille-Q3522]|nr:ferritin-like domain-containing protein [Bacillaceae bacterium Marseille-Q3522]
MNNQKALEQIVNGLNLDLAWEYAAGIQYAQHASLLKGAAYFAVAEELAVHSKDEFGHALELSELIQYLGGIPTTQVAPVYTSMDNEEMLRQDLQGEYDAIRRYLQRIQQLEELRMYDSAQKIRDIAVTEQEHAIDLEIALGIEKNLFPATKLSFE